MIAVWDYKGQFDTYKDQEVFDCLIAEFLLSEGRSMHIPTQEQTFTAYGVTTLDELMKKQQERLDALPRLKNLFQNVEMPLVPVLYNMERNGIVLDAARLKDIGEKIVIAFQALEEEIDKLVGFKINLNSPLQVGNYLVDKEGVPLGKTKTGKYATNENELVKFANQFPIIEKLLTFRELRKLHSTYVESLIEKVDDTGRVHTTYNQVLVATGRLASVNPNLQNIPVSSDFGRQIKSCFSACEGHTLLSFDYSQQELRILAHLTGEEKLIEAFNEKRDVHKTTASQIFSVGYDEVTNDQRQVGKTINFGIIYGMSSYGMSEGLNIPVEEAQKFIDTFYDTYPKIRTFYDTYLKEGRVHNAVETLLGRRRFVTLFPNSKFIDNATKRVLMNYPIQGAAADLMKLAMVKVQKEILDKNPEVKMLLQIHDDLVFEVPDKKELIEKLIPEIRTLMCEIYPLSVPVVVDVKEGKNWGEMKLYQ